MKLAHQQEIEAVVRALGLITPSLSKRQLICAVELAHENVQVMCKVMDNLYPAVAEYFEGANVESVERNLRSARDHVWAKGNVDLLIEMTGCPIRLKPTTGEFVDAIRYYMERERLFPDE